VKPRLFDTPRDRNDGDACGTRRVSLVPEESVTQAVVSTGRGEQHAHTVREPIHGFGGVSFVNLGIVALLLEELRWDIFGQRVGAEDGYGVWWVAVNCSPWLLLACGN
jgi:hypothetical protein